MTRYAPLCKYFFVCGRIYYQGRSLRIRYNRSNLQWIGESLNETLNKWQPEIYYIKTKQEALEQMIDWIDINASLFY